MKLPVFSTSFLRLLPVFLLLLPLPLAGQNDEDDFDWDSVGGGLGGETGDGEDEIIELDLYQVEETEGWVATQATSGTPINMKIADVPIGIESFTQDFLTDTSATDINEALQYSSNVQITRTNTVAGENDQASENPVRVRGILNEGPLRNGYPQLGATDAVNINKVDVVNGPNALLYGRGTMGGAVNYITKEPLPKFYMQSDFQLGSYNYYRAAFDVNVPIMGRDENAKGKFLEAARFTFAHTSFDSYIDFEESQRTYTSGSFLFNFYSRLGETQLLLDYEYIRTDDTNSAGNPLDLGDSNPLYYDPRFVTPEYLAQENTGTLSHPYPGFRYGDGSKKLGHDIGINPRLRHRFNEDLSMELGLYYIEWHREETFNNVDVGNAFAVDYPTIPGFSPGASDNLVNSLESPWANNVTDPLARLDPNDPGLVDPTNIVSNFSRRDRTQTRYQFSTKLTYEFEPWETRQVFVLGTTIRDYSQTIQNAQLVYNDGSGTAVILTAPQQGFESIPFPEEQSQLPELVRDSYTTQWLWENSFGTSYLQENGYYGILTSYWLDGRLITVGGYRYDYTNSQSVTTNRETGESRRGGQDARRTNWSPAFGVTYHIDPKQRFSFFFNTQSGFEARFGTLMFDGQVAVPTTTQSFEGGFKFNEIPFLDGKMFGYITAYQVNRDDVPRFGPNALTPSIQNPNETYGANWYIDDRFEGVDLKLDLIGWLKKGNLSVDSRIGYLYSQFNIDPLREDQVNREFVDSGGVLQRTGGVVREQGEAVVANPEFSNSAPDHSLRFFNKINMKDVYAGGDGFFTIGAVWQTGRSARPAFIQFSETEGIKITDEQLLINASIGYSNEFRLRGRSLQWRAQIVVNNLLDEDDVLGFTYTEPLTWRLGFNLTY